MDLTKPISAAMLTRAGACSAQVRLVRKHFGTKPLRLTRTRLRRAAKAGLDVSRLWQFLPAAARPEYNRVMAAALVKYHRAKAAALAEYDRVVRWGVVEDDRVVAAARAEYNRVTAAALAEYDRVVAAVLADALGLK